MEDDMNRTNPTYRKDKTNEVRILIIGKTGSGKSATGNTLLGNRDDRFKTSPNPRSVTKTSEIKSIVRFNKKLIVVDTPGVFHHADNDSNIKEEVKKSMVLISPGPHAIFLCVPMYRFDKTDVDTMKYYSQLFGSDLSSHGILAFTHFDEWKRKLNDQNNLVDEQNGFLNELPDEYKGFIQKGRYVFVDNKSDSLGEMADEMIKTIIEVNPLNYFTSEKFKEIEKMLQRGDQMETIIKIVKFGVVGGLVVAGVATGAIAVAPFCIGVGRC